MINFFIKDTVRKDLVCPITEKINLLFSRKRRMELYVSKVCFFKDNRSTCVYVIIDKDYKRGYCS